jgi:Ni/Co efflux regulator RcnB
MKKLLLALSAFVFLAAVQAKAEDKPADDKGDMKKDGTKTKMKKGKKMKKHMKDTKDMKDMNHEHGEAPPAK